LFSSFEEDEEPADEEELRDAEEESLWCEFWLDLFFFDLAWTAIGWRSSVRISRRPSGYQ